MTNGNEPVAMLHNASEKDIVINGLTKREYFAAMALQGLLANGEIQPSQIAEYAVLQADSLIYQLNKTKP